VGVIWNYIVNPQGNPVLLFTGVTLIVGAIVVDAQAYRTHQAAKAAGSTALDAGAKRSTWKGIVLSVIGGILMGTFYPLVEIGKKGEGALGPYAIAFVFALGVLVSTFVFNLYFMRFPIQGDRLSFRDYLSGTSRLHILGVAGGTIWLAGSLSNFVAASAPRELQVGPAISYAIGQGAAMVGALWGILLWREFAGAGRYVKWLLVFMFVLFLVGLGLVSIAPLFVGVRQ
jgi:glucose uptake protein